MRREARSLEEQLAELPHLEVPALRTKWEEAFGRPVPGRIRRDMLIRAIAHRIQETERGGLRPTTLRRLRRIAQDLREGRGMASATSHALRPGARLMREWNGEIHMVEVLDRGFGWRGKVYPSLSAVARAITGARWSGPRFFGLLDKPVSGIGGSGNTDKRAVAVRL